MRGLGRYVPAGHTSTSQMKYAVVLDLVNEGSYTTTTITFNVSIRFHLPKTAYKLKTRSLTLHLRRVIDTSQCSAARLPCQERPAR